MQFSRTGVFCAVLIAGTLLFTGSAYAIGAPVTFSTAPTSTPADLSQTPQGCTAAIQLALGQASDGPVSTHFDSTQLDGTTVLATCYGAVLRSGKTPSPNIADYQCVGRSGKAYVVGGLSPNITVETSPDASGKLLPNQCSIAVCNGAKGTVKVCSAAKVYDGGMNLSSDGGLTTGGTTLPSGLSPQPTGSTLNSGTPVNGNSILGQLFNPTPIADQQGSIAPAAQSTNNAFEQAAQSPGFAPAIVSSNLSNSPVTLQGGTLDGAAAPAAPHAQGEVQTVIGADTFSSSPSADSAKTNSGNWFLSAALPAAMAVAPAAETVGAGVLAANPIGLAVLGGGAIIAGCAAYCPASITDPIKDAVVSVRETTAQAFTQNVTSAGVSIMGNITLAERSVYNFFTGGSSAVTETNGTDLTAVSPVTTAQPSFNDYSYLNNTPSPSSLAGQGYVPAPGFSAGQALQGSLTTQGAPTAPVFAGYVSTQGVSQAPVTTGRDRPFSQDFAGSQTGTGVSQPPITHGSDFPIVSFGAGAQTGT
ncbi:hypothetical protein HY418_02525, partial [Candidatus Kaiserbacteria bacterium]|nr:hypothetical protein [Candidatus Kaiserbacteria bacterium]